MMKKEASTGSRSNEARPSAWARIMRFLKALCIFLLFVGPATYFFGAIGFGVGIFSYIWLRFSDLESLFLFLAVVGLATYVLGPHGLIIGIGAYIWGKASDAKKAEKRQAELALLPHNLPRQYHEHWDSLSRKEKRSLIILCQQLNQSQGNAYEKIAKICEGKK